MQDTNKTKKELLEELKVLRKHVAEMTQAAATHQTIVEQSSDSIVYTDAEYRITYINEAAHKLYGWKLEELAGKRPDILNAEPLSEQIQQEIYEAVSAGKTYMGESLNIRKDGSTFLCQMKISPTFDEAGKVYGHIGVSRDITQSDQMMKEVIASQHKYWAIMNQARDAIFIADTETGMLIDANQAAQKMIGRSLEEIKEMHQSDLHPEDLREKYKKIFKEHIEKGSAFEEQRYLINKSGKKIPVEASASVIEVGGQTLIQGVFRDITEKIVRQERLHLQRTALKAAANGILISNAEGKILWVNPAFTELTGYTLEEVEGKSPNIIKSEDTETAIFDDMWSTILSGEAWTGRLVNQRKDGSRYVDEQTITPVFSLDGEISHFISIKQDVTERIQAEEYLQRKLAELTLLQRISMAGAALMDEDEIIDIMTRIIRNTFYSDHLGVLLIDESESVLYPHRSYMGINTEDFTIKIRLGEGVTGKVAETGVPMHISDVSGMKDYIPSLDNLKSELCVPLIVSGKTIGVINVESTNVDEFTEDDVQLLSTISSQMATAIERIRLYKELVHSNEELTTAYDRTLEGWAQALELRDQETQGHTERVTQLTMRLAKKMGIKESEREHIQRGALLHDIGKIGIPDSILFKPASLDEREWEIMKKHPVYAFNILSRVPFLLPATEIPYAHHEHWDGSGYPRGMKGEEIPIAARIFAIADVWDALTTSRPYRAAWNKPETMAYIKEQSGKHFDPQIVKVFLKMIEDEESAS